MNIMMSPRRLVFLAALAAVSLPSHALYKVVGPDGKVTYTDRPPVPPAGKVQSLTPSGTPVSEEALPYELRQVASRYPVTLYTADKCAPCDSGRGYLRQRGIPFAERTITTNADVDAMQRVEGGAEIPTLRIGGQQLKGFSDAEWGSYLDAAGYPKQSTLPPGYVFPQAQPMVSKDVIPAPAAAPRPAPAPAPAAPAASGGIRF